MAKQQQLPKLSQLHALYDQYNRPEFWRTDPIEFLYRYDAFLDRELVALLSAVLAYGNVRQIRNSIEDLLRRVHSVVSRPSMVYAVFGTNQEDLLREALRSFKHRFNVGEDIFYLLKALGQEVRAHASLERAFARHLKSEDRDFGDALSQWISILSQASGVSPSHRSSFHYLLTAPSRGSTCKRWCMFLRWMGRQDAVDPGLWSKSLRADQLVIPLDTHTGRISQHYRLTHRRSLNWKAALEVTQSLRLFDANDPVKFDFALSRLGIVEKKTRDKPRR